MKPILDDSDKLFEIEREAKSFDELLILRKSECRIVILDLKQKLFDEIPKSRPSSQKRKAIEYLTK